MIVVFAQRRMRALQKTAVQYLALPRYSFSKLRFSCLDSCPYTLQLLSAPSSCLKLACNTAERPPVPPVRGANVHGHPLLAQYSIPSLSGGPH